MPEVARDLPIPQEYAAMGVRRYGAHGISYESIIYQLEPQVPEKLIVAHLGNGASICAIRNGASIDTSMGLTPTGGIISATRTGDIDPGVLLFILRKIAAKTPSAKEAADKLETVGSEQSGLLGGSGISSDMRDLRNAIEKGNAQVRLAVDLFVRSIRKFIGAYIAELGGLDMLVLTGGIGVHDAATRAEICSGLEPLGIVLDATRNNTREATTISTSDSRVEVRVIPPEEDLMIVNHVVLLLGS
jgi:acetate kinase